MAALRQAARKLFLQRTQASAVECRLVPRLIHAGRPASSASVAQETATLKDLTDPNDKEAIAERIILVKGKVEELYGISSSIERHLIGRGPYVRFNRKVVSELSSLVDPKPEDPVWTQMQTSRIRTKFLKFAGFIVYSYVLLHLPQLHNKKDEKTALGPGGMGEVPIA
nr:uncharacterized protein LOC127338766 [Lolium perenne]